jgi:hypothetical protein
MSGVWKRWAQLLAGLVVLSAAAWWVLHPRPSDRELIEELIAKAEHGVETKSVKEVMSCVASDYHDPEGLSSTDVWRLAMQWSRSSAEADVVIEDYKLDIGPSQARGEFAVRVITEGLGVNQPIAMRLTVEFTKRRRGLRKVWLVKSVSGHGLSSALETF